MVVISLETGKKIEAHQQSCMEPGESGKGGRCHENEIHGIREKRQTLFHSKRIERSIPL